MCRTLDGWRLNQPMLPTHSQARILPILLPAISGAGLAVGLALRLAGRPDWGEAIWAIATVPVLLSLLVQIIRSLRRGETGLDIVAALSMSAALAFGEYLAAAVVALMYAGGNFLESFAERRAGREMTALLSRVPRTALRMRNSHLEEVALEAVEPGDRIVVRTGEIVPVDGMAESEALLDYSSLTGESLPVKREINEAVLSGGGNVGRAFNLLARRSAAQSTFAGIVRLVEEARGSKAPMTRLADRYAIVFLIFTVVVSLGAWLWSGDPIRALSVLVIATPCPLILAVPVAIVSGLSRAAKAGVLIKGGKALEALARIRTVVVDKTGTLTGGAARLIAAHTVSNFAADEAIRIAASLDQASTHIIAQAIVAEAHARKLSLSAPTHIDETAGEGVSGRVENMNVVVGGMKYVRRHARAGNPLPLKSHKMAGAVIVALAINGKIVAIFVLADALRTGVKGFLDALRANGIERVVLASGDRQTVAEHIAAGLPIDVVKGDLSPEEKVAIVLSERRRAPVMMVGDGVNDAPALAAADVGVAMGATGAAASAEAADVVILLDRLDALLPALKIARRAKAIALESVIAGLSLSIVGMVVAAFGYLTPVEGAMIQEAIDVMVIVNALRVLR
jgi:heavy metal translocating P-type ATPase